MTRTDGSTNEDIGRPGPWKEGRYQEPNPDTPASAPVTRKDYEFPDSAPTTNSSSEPPGGDAG
jgi:hypothetical protein